MNPGNSQEALAQLKQSQSAAMNPNQFLETQRQKLGVGAAQDTVTGLRGAIDNTTKLLKQVAPGVMGRTQNSLVTTAQSNRIIQNEQAPISENLTEQGRQYGQASEDFNRLEGQASQAAGADYTAQQDRIGYLQNLYNTLYGREQDEVAKAERDRAFAETQAQARRAASGGGGAGGYSLGGGVEASQPSGGIPGMTPKDAMGSGKSGYNFEVSGKPASAATFAAANKIPFADLLYRMASSGDSTAQSAYQWLKSIQGTDLWNSGKWKQTPAAQRFSSLLWGS